jgi:hypothetical protein
MSDLIPAQPGRSRRQLVQAARAQERGELEVFRHHVAARVLTECEEIDARALADVTRTALEEEMGVLDEGLAKAAGSVAKAELVSRMVAMQSRIDSARIARRFGG